MARLTRSEINPTEFYDHEDRFQAYSFAEALLEPRDEPGGQPLYFFATDAVTDTLYWHDGRTWDAQGEKVLRDETRAILRDASSREKVNEVVRNVKSLSRRDRADIFDLPPEKLVVANGVLNLRTGEFSRKFDRPGTLTWVDVDYDPEAHPERFNEFLFEILPREDVSTMWEVIGYCLYRGYPFQKAVMLLGEGANGKSTLLATLREFLGKRNVAATELQSLAENRFAAADLEGKLANIAPDISDEDLGRTGTFKALTGGDLITAERKYQDSFEFENAATLIFSANRAPSADDQTHAYERRWLYFRFPHRFDGEECPGCGEVHESAPQEELLGAFREEHAGILNLAVESFTRLWERGGFESTTYMAEHGDGVHDRTTRPLVRFVQDELEATDPEEYVRVKAAHEAYQEWAEDHGHPVQGRQQFERVVRSTYDVQADRDPLDGNYKIWRCVRLPDDDAGEGQQRL